MVKLGDTNIGAWMSELVTACVREVGGRDQFDFNMLYRMVQSEPIRAGEAMQLWAQDIRHELGDQPVASATSSTATKVTLVGLMALALEMKGEKANAPRARPDGFTEFVDNLMKIQPIIYDCLNHASALFPNQ